MFLIYYFSPRAVRGATLRLSLAFQSDSPMMYTASHSASLSDVRNSKADLNPTYVTNCSPSQWYSC